MQPPHPTLSPETKNRLSSQGRKRRFRGTTLLPAPTQRVRTDAQPDNGRFRTAYSNLNVCSAVGSGVNFSRHPQEGSPACGLPSLQGKRRDTLSFVARWFSSARWTPAEPVLPRRTVDRPGRPRWTRWTGTGAKTRQASPVAPYLTLQPHTLRDSPAVYHKITTVDCGLRISLLPSQFAIRNSQFAMTLRCSLAPHLIEQQRCRHGDVEGFGPPVQRYADRGLRDGAPCRVRPFAFIPKHHCEGRAVVGLLVADRPRLVRDEDPHAVPPQQRDRLLCGGGHDGKVEERSHRGPHHFGVGWIDRTVRGQNRRRSGRIRGADDRTEISRILETVGHDHDQASDVEQVGQDRRGPFDDGHHPLGGFDLAARRHDVRSGRYQARAMPAGAVEESLPTRPGERVRIIDQHLDWHARVEHFLQPPHPFDTHAGLGLPGLRVQERADALDEKILCTCDFGAPSGYKLDSSLARACFSPKTTRTSPARSSVSPPGTTTI